MFLLGWEGVEDLAPKPRNSRRARLQTVAIVTAAVAFSVLAAGVANVAVTSPSHHELSLLADEEQGQDNADLRLGRIAYQRGDFAAAEQDLRRALAQLTDVGDRREAQTLLAASAFRSGNFRTTIATLAGRDSDQEDCEHLLLLAAAYVEAGELAKGMTLFATARERFPDDPAPLYWEAHYKFVHGEVDVLWVNGVAERLKSFTSPKGVRLRGALQQLIQPKPGTGKQAVQSQPLLHAASKQP